MQPRTPAGWYPDPQRRTTLRWWDGAAWTAWASDGARVWDERPPALGPQHLDGLRFVREVFLPEARRRGAVPGPWADGLERLTDDLTDEARSAGRPGAAAAPTTASSATSTAGAAPAAGPPDVIRPADGATWPQTPTPYPVPPTATHPAQPAPTGPATARPTPLPYSPRPPAQPGPVARWWAEVRTRLDLDLTVHGLAYLGVLLLFVGVFGLVAFAFGDVAPRMRPVAELAVAVVPFVAARVLASSGARFVARAMVALGGLLLALMLITSTVDGAPFPPDLHGAALPLGTGLGCAALAAGYVLVGRRRPRTALLAVVAPVLWLAAAMGAVGLARPLPVGEDVAIPGAAQVAVLALAVLTTTLVGRAWADPVTDARGTDTTSGTTGASPGQMPDAAPDSSPDATTSAPLRARLAEGALAAAGPGAVVTAVLAVVAGLVEGWPVLPFAVTVLALAVVVRVAGRVSAAAGDLAVVVAWLVVVVRVLATDLGAPLLSASHDAVVGPAVQPVLVPAVLALGVLLGELLLDRGHGTGRVLLVWALPVLALLAVPDGWWAVGALVLLAVWATWRRTRPASVRGLGGGLDVAAAAAPLLALTAVGREVEAPWTVVLAAALVLAATPLARGRLRRPGAPHLWLWWWAAVGVIALVSSAGGAVAGWLTEGVLWPRVAVPVAVLVVLVAVVTGPLPRTWTVVAATPVVWWAWLTAAIALEVDVVVRAGVLALLGLGAVLLGHRRGAPGEPTERRRARGVLGLAGHATGVAALLLVVDPAPAPHLFGAPGPVVALTLVVLLGSLGWLATALASDRTGSPVVALTDRLGAPGRHGPWALALAGSVTTTVLVLHVTGALRVDDPWWPVVPAGAGLVLAGLTRALRTGRVLPLLPWFAFGLVLLGVVTSSGGWPTAVALAAVVAQVVLTRGRHAVQVWTGWAVLTPLAVVVTWQLSDGAFVRSVLGPAALVAVGGLLAVGAHLADPARPDDPRLLPRRRPALPPAVLGAGQVALGVLVAAVALDVWRAGIVLTGAAVVVALLAALTGVGTVGAVAVLLAWAGGPGLLGRDHPGAWAHVATALAMAAVAQGLAGGGALRARWARWDVPLAVGAALPALVAVAVAEPHERIGVRLVVGAAVVAAAVSLRRRRRLSEVLGWVGTALVLSATVDAGPWWTVLALVVLSAAHTALAAVRERGTVRVVRQWVGALAGAAAWVVVPVAAGWDRQRTSEVTAVLAAAAVLAVVLAVRTAGRGRSWLPPWAGVGTLLAVGAAVGLVVDPRRAALRWFGVEAPVAPLTVDGLVLTTWWHTAAWLLLTAAAVVLVGVVVWGWWREVAVATTTAALLVAMGAAGLPGTARVLVLVAVSCAAAVGVVLLGRTGSPWTRATSALGVATVVLAGVLLPGATDILLPAATGGATTVPGILPALVAAVLAAAAVQCAALGVAWRVLALRMAAPVVAWCAWAVYAAQSLGASPVWFTVPVGLALLAVVAVWRADRRERGLPPVDRGVVGLELAGIAFLVVSSFVAAVAVSVLHALVAAGIGVLVALWGVATRVRRRLLAGGAVVLAGVALAVIVPLAALLPAAGQVGTWVLVAVLGLVVVVAATFLERGRTTVRDGRARLVEATRGWE